MKIKIIRRKTSSYAKELSRVMNAPLHKNKSPYKPELFINYGKAGGALEQWKHENPKMKNVPMFNAHIETSKLRAIKRIGNIGVPIPKTTQDESKLNNRNDWIIKRICSIGGKGIISANERKRNGNEYYQKRIRNRRYEVRIHAMQWIDKKDWFVQKRIGEKGKIAWNKKQGGKFIAVNNPNNYRVFRECKDYAEKILHELDYQFGGIDFIIDEHNGIYFIEINSACGFSVQNTRDYYHKAFAKLAHMSIIELLSFIKPQSDESAQN